MIYHLLEIFMKHALLSKSTNFQPPHTIKIYAWFLLNNIYIDSENVVLMKLFHVSHHMYCQRLEYQDNKYCMLRQRSFEINAVLRATSDDEQQLDEMTWDSMRTNQLRLVARQFLIHGNHALRMIASIKNCRFLTCREKKQCNMLPKSSRVNIPISLY